MGEGEALHIRGKWLKKKMQIVLTCICARELWGMCGPGEAEQRARVAAEHWGRPAALYAVLTKKEILTLWGGFVIPLRVLLTEFNLILKVTQCIQVKIQISP